MRDIAVVTGCLLLAGCLPPDVRLLPPERREYREAEVLFLRGEYERAHDLLSRLVAEHPSGAALLLRAKCSLLGGRSARADREFTAARRGAESLDQYVQATLGLADTRYAAGNYRECIPLYALLLDRYRERIPRPVVMLRYGHSLLRRGEREKGERVCAEVVRLFPLSRAAREARGLLQGLTGGFYIQFGLFAGRENAERVNAAARSRGFDTVVRPGSGGGFAVVLGSFASAGDARRKLAEVHAAGFGGAFIKP